MAQEIGHVELVPERLAGVVAQAGQAGQARGLLAAFGQHGVGVGVGAAQRRQRQLVQVLEQLAFPGVPDLGAGAADVGHGQQVERGQVTLVLDRGGEVLDHGGVGQVALLRHGRHQQVLAHQEFDQPGVFRLHAVVVGELAHLARAQLGVVAAAALGDVVEQRRHVQQPVPVQAGDQLAGQRILLGMLGHGEAAQVAHHRQRVLVHRIGVERVVLHLADDAAEHRQVARQDVQHGHAAQLVHDAARLLQDLQEQLAVDRVAAELRVDAMARVPDGAQRARRHAGQFGMLLHHQEGAQQQRGVPLEAVVADDVETVAQVAEIVVDVVRVAVGAREQAFLDVLHQDAVELRHQARGPVVALHQQLAAAPRGGGVDAVDLGQGRLQVEQHAVFAAPGQQVQLDAQALEGLFGLAQVARLGRGQQACLRHRAPVLAEAGRARHPQDHLQVAQAAGRFLAIGFERVGRVLVARVALLHLDALGAEERARVQPRLGGGLELLHQRAAAGQPARFKQRGFHRDVGVGLALAVLDGAHAVAGLQAQVPERGDQLLDGGLVLGGGGVRQQDQQVDVGVRVQFAAAVAAHRRQRGAGRQGIVLDQVAQRRVDDAAQFAQQRVGAFVLAELGHRGPPGFLDAFAQGAEDVGGHGGGRPAVRRRG
ncbi:Uncharacterised protein [Achromobacter sp. 2789STDY5608615]|nr:Uncharacterised protein [Achromobacter sp. 2789STDY5608615]